VAKLKVAKTTRSKLKKMFKRPLDEYVLKCSDCPRTYTPAELASARAHQNFKGHKIVVHHVQEGGIGPLNTF